MTELDEKELEGDTEDKLLLTDAEGAPSIADLLAAEKEAEANAREAATGGPKEKDPVDTSPNVKFIGTRQRNGVEERLTEAPDNLISGPDIFDNLPSSEEQIDGFYYERAAELCRAFPGLYKRIIKKGE